MLTHVSQTRRRLATLITATIIVGSLGTMAAVVLTREQVCDQRISGRSEAGLAKAHAEPRDNEVSTGAGS